MATTTPIAGWPLPSSGDTDQVPADMSALAVQIEQNSLLKFSTSTTRDAKITSPVAGMECWLNTPGDFFHYTGSAWVQGRAGLKSITAGNVMVGTNSGQPVIVQAGNTVMTIGASAGCFITFTTPFPNFLSSVVLTEGDNNTQPHTFSTILASCTLSLWFGVAYLGAAAVTNGTLVRANWIAVGG